MAIKPLPISSCWIVTEGLIGLQNQAIGLAQALGVDYDLKQVKRSWFWQTNILKEQGLTPPWPQMVISCGRQSVAASMAIRRASRIKTFTVHIQDPLVDPQEFDVVIVPAHDKTRGNNVFVTQGAVHHVTVDKLNTAADHFRALFASLPRPLISVLVGGKNKHQGFSAALAHDFAHKLKTAAADSKGALAVSFSRRTGAANEAILRNDLSGVPSYIWDGKGENPYFGLLALADAIVVTSDSISMISESCSTGKPVYIYELPHCGRRHKELVEGMVQDGFARAFTGNIDIWKNTPLDETWRAADFVQKSFLAKSRDLNLAHK